ncbi:MAG: AbrB/MazE/SpoVT family DNA-binding domain-containing protein [Planctomycetia bacterium]|nr:AbrB/MazE/SpoVT family DNA-binding domain-containing protein [Planctomycetia bacterium]
MNTKVYTPSIGGEEAMAISKVGQRRQVVLPKEICEDLGLKEGDFVEVKESRGFVLIKPKKLVDSDDILIPEEETLIRKGEAQLKRGEYVLWDDLKKKIKG